MRSNHRAVAQDRSADITFSSTGIAAGVGYTWGDGTLHFKGADYRFTVNDLRGADVGAAHFDGAGDVYNLQRLEAGGTYVAAGAGAAVAGGGALVALENQKGVRIYLRSTAQGLKFNLSTDGVRVTLK